MCYMCICSECSLSQAQNLTNNALKLLQNYAWLIDSFLLDFFVDEHWKKLPSSWQIIFEKLPADELGHWLDQNSPVRSYKEVWPLSLLALKTTAMYLTIPRQPTLKPTGSNFKSNFKSSINTQHFYPLHQEGCTHCQCLTFDVISSIDSNSKIFSQHVKPKKFHEIHEMAKVTINCSKKLACSYIVDVGSGLGHLGRILAYCHGLNVCCLEEQPNLSVKARLLDKQVEKLLKKKNLGGSFTPPVHINMTIQSVINKNEFVKIVQEAFCIEEGANFEFGIIGLHPCGDLGPTLLRLFQGCTQARFINLVGCCYMKLSDEGSSMERGYPMSHYITNQPHRISYEAREVACHAIETYCHRLRVGKVEELKVHCYRATLEELIVNHWPDLRHSGLRSIKHVQGMAFSNYAELAVERLGLRLPIAELDQAEIQSKLDQWLKVVAFYSLRLLLAPVVESALLLDRILFLKESGIPNFIIPVFDPDLSPRNHILVGMKKALKTL